MADQCKNEAAVGLRSAECKPYAFAGIWERWKPKEGEPLETFTILTTDPNELAERVHDRMPVILALNDYCPGTLRAPAGRPAPYPAERMRSWPVQERVGNVRNNNPALLTESHPENLQF